MAHPLGQQDLITFDNDTEGFESQEPLSPSVTLATHRSSGLGSVDPLENTKEEEFVPKRTSVQQGSSARRTLDDAVLRQLQQKLNLPASNHEMQTNASDEHEEVQNVDQVTSYQSQKSPTFQPEKSPIAKNALDPSVLLELKKRLGN